MKVRTIFNAQELRDTGEVNTSPSMTVPDQTMSVREIMDRYARGLPVGGSRLPQYDEEDDMPDIKTLDLVERQELAYQYGQEIDMLRKPKKRASGKKAEKPNEDADDEAALLEPPVQTQQTQSNS